MPERTPLLVRLPVSHYCKKVEWALDHVGQEYAARDVWFRTLVDFRDVNPENTVPVLDVAEGLLCGSATILGWLDARHPDAGLYPDQETAAWEAWADQTIGPLVRRDTYRALHAHPTRYTRNPAAWLLFRMARPLFLNILKFAKARRYEQADEAARGPMLDRIHAQLAHGPYLFADHPTAADFATAGLLYPLLRLRDPRYTGHPGWPSIKAYVQRMRRPAPRARRLRDAERARLAARPKITAA